METNTERIIDIEKYDERYKRTSEYIANLSCDLFRITFCGKFKSGKSSLINTLLGVKLLPVKTVTATAVITKVFYNKEPIAYAVKDGQKITISFDEISKYILVSDKTLNGVTTSGVKEVCIGIPSEFLSSGIMLIDTPGLDDQDSLTEITLKEINNTDLAVLVYDANQMLSENEQMTADYINKLLGGNLIFVVNRTDQIMDGDINDVKKIADYYLSEFGNAYIGKERIFYTAANGQKCNITVFKRWIEKIISSSSYKSNIARLSRLSVTQSYLDESLSMINNDIADLDMKIIELNKKAKSIIDKKVKSKKMDLKNLRLNLSQFKFNMIGSLDNECIKAVMEKLIKLKTGADWQNKFSDKSKSTVKNYYVDFLNDNKAILLKKYSLNFIRVPDLSISNTFDNLYFPSAKGESKWTGSVIAGGIGTIVAPGLGTIIGAAIGKAIDSVSSSDAAVKACVPSAVLKTRRDVNPKIKILIENFFNELEGLINNYENSLSFSSGYEDKLSQHNQAMNHLIKTKSMIENIQSKVSIRIFNVKKDCKII